MTFQTERSGKKMKAIQLDGIEGLGSLKVVELERPHPGENEVLIEVKAAGVNFAELEMARGRYPAPRLCRRIWDLKRRGWWLNWAPLRPV